MAVEPQFDVHQLRYDEQKGELDGPIGMDPCQTLVQFAYAKLKQEQIEKVYRKDLKRSFIKQGDLTEGVFREDLDYIPLPQPQNYHNYCQICSVNYENYEAHIKSDFHQRKSRNQAQHADIDNIIDELNHEKRWLKPIQNNSYSKKETQLGDVELLFAILKDGKSIKHYAQYMKENLLDDHGRRLNGRSSATGFKVTSGKASKTSVKRMSAKASACRIKDLEKSYTLKEGYQHQHIRVQQTNKFQEERLKNVPNNFPDPRNVISTEDLPYELKKNKELHDYYKRTNQHGRVQSRSSLMGTPKLMGAKIINGFENKTPREKEGYL